MKIKRFLLKLILSKEDKELIKEVIEDALVGKYFGYYFTSRDKYEEGFIKLKKIQRDLYKDLLK